jgi:hypothetical protein
MLQCLLQTIVSLELLQAIEAAQAKDRGAVFYFHYSLCQWQGLLENKSMNAIVWPPIVRLCVREKDG